jgi:hypothetical protein
LLKFIPNSATNTNKDPLIYAATPRNYNNNYYYYYRKRPNKVSSNAHRKSNIRGKAKSRGGMGNNEAFCSGSDWRPTSENCKMYR